jgi:hypothetical protein
VNSPSPFFSSTPNHPLPFPRPHKTYSSHLLSGPSPCRRRDQTAAASHRRAPTPATPPPRLRLPPGPR